MKRINSKLSLAALTVAASTSAGAVSAATPQRPNIVFIYADDMGYGDVSCYNPESKIPTPTFDRVASEGLTFTDAHTNSSVSTPSRYGVMTGRYTWRSRLKNGVLGGFSPALIEKNRPTVASMLKKSGYQTYCIGKWHLGVDGWVNKDGSKVKNENSLTNMGIDVDYENVTLSGPADRGFDYFYGIAGSLDMPPYLIIENDKVIEKPTVLYDRKNGGPKSPYGRDGYGVKGRQPAYFLEHFTQKVVSTIESSSKSDSPFFIYYAMTAPHAPISPHADFKGKSGAGLHGDFVMEIDYRISQIYDALKAAGVDKNTLVVISSDNGPETSAYQRFETTGHSSSGNLRGVKRDLWEGGHRVPMFVTWPEMIKKPREVNETVCMLDFYATAADIVGHSISGSEAPDSFSYLSLISGKGKHERDFTVHHSASGRFAIRKGDWVLIETKTGNDNNSRSKGGADYYAKKGYPAASADTNGELYNLRLDIEERNDQYAANPDLVKELTQILNNCRK